MPESRVEGPQEGVQVLALLAAARLSTEKISGKASGWEELTEWVAIHHDAVMNATLAHYLKVCEQEPATTFADVAKKRFLFLTVPYKKDSSHAPGEAVDALYCSADPQRRHIHILA